MSDRAQKLLHDVMELPLAERAKLIADALAALDGAEDQDVDAAWVREVELRAKAAIANPDDDIAWETVRNELHASHSR